MQGFGFFLFFFCTSDLFFLFFFLGCTVSLFPLTLCVAAVFSLRRGSMEFWLFIVLFFLPSGPRPPSDPHGRYPEKHISGMGMSSAVCAFRRFCVYFEPVINAVLFPLFQT